MTTPTECVNEWDAEVTNCSRSAQVGPAVSR